MVKNRTGLTGFHFHVYFSPDEYEFAESLCRRAAKDFLLHMGRMHNQPIGPHTTGSCLLGVPLSKFEDLSLFFMQNRGALTIFVHGLSGDDYADHTDYVMWLGPSRDLNLEAL